MDPPCYFADYCFKVVTFLFFFFVQSVVLFFFALNFAGKENTLFNFPDTDDRKRRFLYGLRIRKGKEKNRRTEVSIL